MYVFGSPRVFSFDSHSRVRALLEDVLIRVTHYNDLVPKVPLALMNYRHIGTEIHYPEYNDWDVFKECKDTQEAESQECMNAVSSFGVSAHLTYLGVLVSRRCGPVSFDFKLKKII